MNLQPIPEVFTDWEIDLEPIKNSLSISCPNMLIISYRYFIINSIEGHRQVDRDSKQEFWILNIIFYITREIQDCILFIRFFSETLLGFY